MSSTIDHKRSSTPAKAQWVKPAVTELKAGAAEAGTSNGGDVGGGGQVRS